MLTVTAAAGGDGASQLARVPALRLSHDAELPLHQPLQLLGGQIIQHLCEFGVLAWGVECCGSALVLWALWLPGHVGEEKALPPQ